MSRWRVLAPAKLTWSLQIGDRRDDGYHDLVAEMLTVDLADELVIDDEQVGLSVEGTAYSRAELLGAGEENLVIRALALAGRSAGVQLRKRIPIGGGLGGGSADAGAVLRWAQIGDPAVAAQLGGDVPFCTRGGRAMVRGLGEIIELLDEVDRQVTLLVPPFSVNTALAYRALDELRAGGRGRHERNDLTEAAEVVEPRIRRWRQALSQETGAEVILAGSGSTLFCEGSPATLGLSEGVFEVDGERGMLLGARTVPRSVGMPQSL